MNLTSGRPSQKEKAIEAMKVEEVAVKTDRLNVEIPMSLKYKIRAAQEGLKLNELTIKVFNEYLSKNINE